VTLDTLAAVGGIVTAVCALIGVGVLAYSGTRRWLAVTRGTMVEEGKKTIEVKTQPDEEPFDVQAVNPRYKGAWMSDVVRALVRPTDPKVAAIIEARRSELEDT